MDRVCEHAYCLLVTLASFPGLPEGLGMRLVYVNKGQKLVAHQLAITYREPQKHVFPSYIYILQPLSACLSEQGRLDGGSKPRQRRNHSHTSFVIYK